MKVLVVGSGGREHAICWKLRQSPRVTELFCTPGSAGISGVAEQISLPVDDTKGIIEFSRTKALDLVVVGPEYPLSRGLADQLRVAGIRVFGPSQEAAQLETSKSFAKRMMLEAGVPTARHEVVQTRDEAQKVTSSIGVPIVLKDDGLASGKGVFVCHANDEVKVALNTLFGANGERSGRVVIEEFLPGVEISYIVATDGENIVPFAPSHDYKRIFDGDRGPNTGGMGSVCPTPRCTDSDEEAAIYQVMVPMIAHMKRRGMPFRGFLYAGLMKSPKGELKVLEFNVRLGDPETQSIMRVLDTDLFTLLYELSDPEPVAREDLAAVEWKNTFAVCVVLAAEGYPGTPTSGDVISGIELAETMPNVVVFHAGTEKTEKGWVATGGRVLGVTCTGETLEHATAGAHRAADVIQFRGSQRRRDVGKDTIPV